VVHADLANPALQLEGVGAPDRRDALYRLSALDQTLPWPPGRVRLPGPDPDFAYRVTAQVPGDALAGGALRPGGAGRV
jgi:alpha-galactosidase